MLSLIKQMSIKEMLSIGSGEIILIAAISILVLRPEDLPEIASFIKRARSLWRAQFSHFTDDLQPESKIQGDDGKWYAQFTLDDLAFEPLNHSPSSPKYGSEVDSEAVDTERLGLNPNTEK